MRFRVRKGFDWLGRRYSPGDIVDIPDGHPRLGGLVRGGFVIYDCSLPSLDDRSGKPVSAKSAMRK